MRIMKFEGATMRDAVAKVKAELGDQAVIISSRQVRKGLLGHAVEISAAIDDGDDDRAIEPALPASPAFTARPATVALRGEEPLPQPSKEDVEKAIAPLRSELKSLRAMVRAGNDTKKLESEISALRQLVEKLTGTQPAPRSAPATQASPSSIAEAVAGLANKRARVEATVEVPLIAPSTARIVMLVGPTGAGKTTTIAKLAAHAALVEGRSVRLITLDTFRVGGVDQIRTFAELIGVPLTVLERPTELADAIADAVDDENELVLIDTAGRSPRDAAAIIELAAAVGTLPECEVHLAIPASSSAQQIDDMVTRYTALQPSRLLFTKVDEHDAIPQLLEAPRRTRLPITWVTTGQQVPEDLEQPTAQRLGHLAAHGIAPLATTTRNRKAS